MIQTPPKNQNDEAAADQAPADDDAAKPLPAASLEQGAAASTFEPNPDAPEGSIAQVERLPDE